MVKEGRQVDHQYIEEIFYPALVKKISGIQDRGLYIRDTLSSSMNLHRDRSNPLPEETVVSRLLSSNPTKPGEVFEFIPERMDSLFHHGGTVTPALGLEIADLLYYGYQPGGRRILFLSDESAEPTFANNWLMKSIFGVDLNTAQLFCIAKYLTRMRFDRFPNFKDLETSMITLLLKDL